MKKIIGIVGGLSPESTVYYYQYITRQYTRRFNDFNYPKIVIYSVSFQNYIDWMKDKNWQACEDDLVSAVDALKAAGADFAVIATNTLHYFYDKIVERVDIPVLSLVEAVCNRAHEFGITKIVLLGTKFTMTKSFYIDALAKVGVKTLVPNSEEQTFIHDVIFDELSRGIINNDSKKLYLEIIQELVEEGAQGVILGCTEIPLLINQDDLKIHVLDSSQLHAEAALEYALE